MIQFLKTHKFGLLGTLVLHFVILFATSHWYMPSLAEKNEKYLVIEFPGVPLPEERLIAEEKYEEEENATDDASNKAVNETAPEVKEGDNNNFSEQSQARVDEQINEELKALEQEVIDSQRESGYGYTEEQAEQLLNAKRNRDLDNLQSQQPRDQSAFKGNTNITYKLANRYDVYLKVPVYLCQYGGVIVLNIAVDNTGRVISAKVDSESSNTSDNCLIRAALKGAKLTKFNNINTSGIQKGSITYKFITQ